MPSIVNAGFVVGYLKLDTSQFKQALIGVNRDIQLSQQTWKQMYGEIGNFAQKATIALGAISYVVGNAALKSASQWQQTDLAFTAMLGSGDAAAEMMDRLGNLAVKTGQRVTDTSKTAVGLLNRGIKNDQLETAMKAILGIAAASGKGKEAINNVGLALGQMASKGKIMSEEMSRQLGEYVPAWSILASQMGKSVSEVMAMAKKGQLDSATYLPMLLEGINQRYAKILEAYPQTAQGRWNNIINKLELWVRDNRDQILETANGVLTIVEKMVNWLTSMDASTIVRGLGFTLALAVGGQLIMRLAMVVNSIHSVRMAHMLADAQAAKSAAQDIKKADAAMRVATADRAAALAAKQRADAEVAREVNFLDERRRNGTLDPLTQRAGEERIFHAQESAEEHNRNLREAESRMHVAQGSRGEAQERLDKALPGARRAQRTLPAEAQRRLGLGVIDDVAGPATNATAQGATRASRSVDALTTSLAGSGAAAQTQATQIARSTAAVQTQTGQMVASTGPQSTAVNTVTAEITAQTTAIERNTTARGKNASTPLGGGPAPVGGVQAGERNAARTVEEGAESAAERGGKQAVTEVAETAAGIGVGEVAARDAAKSRGIWATFSGWFKNLWKSMVEGITGLFGALTGRAAGAATAIRTSFAALTGINPIVAAIVAAILVAIGGLVWLANRFKWVGDTLKNTWADLSSAFKDAFRALGDALREVWIILEPFVKLLAGALGLALLAIVKIVGGVLAFALRTFAALLSVVVGAVQLLIDAFKLLWAVLSGDTNAKIAAHTRVLAAWHYMINNVALAWDKLLLSLGGAFASDKWVEDMKARIKELEDEIKKNRETMWDIKPKKGKGKKEEPTPPQKEPPKDTSVDTKELDRQQDIKNEIAKEKQAWDEYQKDYAAKKKRMNADIAAAETAEEKASAQSRLKILNIEYQERKQLHRVLIEEQVALQKATTKEAQTAVKHEFDLRKSRVEEYYGRIKDQQEWENARTEKNIRKAEELRKRLLDARLSDEERVASLQNTLAEKAIERTKLQSELKDANDPAEHERVAQKIREIDLELEHEKRQEDIRRRHEDKIAREQNEEKRKLLTTQMNIALSNETSLHARRLANIQIESEAKVKALDREQKYAEELLKTKRLQEDVTETASWKRKEMALTRERQLIESRRSIMGESWAEMTSALLDAQEAQVSVDRERETINKDAQRAEEDLRKEWEKSDKSQKTAQTFAERHKQVQIKLKSDLDSLLMSYSDRLYSVKLKLDQSALEAWKDQIHNAINRPIFDNPEFKKGIEYAMRSAGQMMNPGATDAEKKSFMADYNSRNFPTRDQLLPFNAFKDQFLASGNTTLNLPPTVLAQILNSTGQVAETPNLAATVTPAYLAAALSGVAQPTASASVANGQAQVDGFTLSNMLAPVMQSALATMPIPLIGNVMPNIATPAPMVAGPMPMVTSTSTDVPEVILRVVEGDTFGARVETIADKRVYTILEQRGRNERAGFSGK